MADISTSPTNADEPVTDTTGGDFGLDQPTVTLDQTQATSEQSSFSGPVPILKPGIRDADGRLLSNEVLWRFLPD